MAQFELVNEHATDDLALLLKPHLLQGDVVFLQGPLGVGKTRFVKGMVRAFGFEGVVKSPTYNLLLEYPTQPKILHADLYRVQSAAGIGFEEYLDEAISFIEWPNRDPAFFESSPIWKLDFAFSGETRIVNLTAPEGRIFP